MNDKDKGYMKIFSCINDDKVKDLVIRKCVHCETYFVNELDYENHQSQYCHECRAKHFGNEVIEEEE